MRWAIFVFLLVNIYGCRINFSFTGASISPEIKTVSIQYFPNYAQLVHPSLSQEFTEALKDRFISQTSLKLVNGSGDLDFEGEITDYDVKPVAIQDNETAALNRLTIGVHVKFTNTKEPAKDFDTSFRAYEDYSSDKSLDDVQDDLMKIIIDKLTEDIFNKAVVNW